MLEIYGLVNWYIQIRQCTAGNDIFFTHITLCDPAEMLF